MQTRITILKTFALFGAAVLAVDIFLLSPGRIRFVPVFIAESILLSGLGIWSLVLERRIARSQEYRTNLTEILPNRYLGRHLSRTFFESVSTKTLKSRTGFVGAFGPVRIDDIGKYRTAPADSTIRTVTFSAVTRLEMATGTLFIPTVILCLVFNFIGPKTLLVVLPAVYALAFLSALVFPHRFVRDVRAWSLVCSILAFLAVLGFSALISPWPGMVYAITIGAVALYLINEFEGWSPLVKFSFTAAYLRARIEIDRNRCIGCGACVEVCPKAVYAVENRKSLVVALTACISCKSCIAQCPTDAIDHSAKTINETF